jgi:hypothetical protein
MIALLFALLTAAMLLAYRQRITLAYALFGVAILLAAYWLKFHATSPLTIQL